MYRHTRMPSSGRHIWSYWDVCPINVAESRQRWELYIVIPRPSLRLQYTAPIFRCFLRHWSHISVRSHMSSWWWHPSMPKHVGEYWVLIHRTINAFVCFSFISRKCMGQNAKRTNPSTLCPIVNYVQVYFHLPFTSLMMSLQYAPWGNTLRL
jgi:hypothetical protein